MLEGKVSVVKALQDFFSTGEHGKKISIDEFKALAEKDKSEFVDMLRGVGYDVADYTPKAAA